MNWLLKLFGYLSMAPLKGYRTQVLGIAVALSGIINSVAGWSVGDMSFGDALTAIAANWEQLVIGFGFWFGGDKLNEMIGKPTTAALFGWAPPVKKK